MNTRKKKQVHVLLNSLRPMLSCMRLGGGLRLGAQAACRAPFAAPGIFSRAIPAACRSGNMHCSGRAAPVLPGVLAALGLAGGGGCRVAQARAGWVRRQESGNVQAPAVKMWERGRTVGGRER